MKWLPAQSREASVCRERIFRSWMSFRSGIPAASIYKQTCASIQKTHQRRRDHVIMTKHCKTKSSKHSLTSCSKPSTRAERLRRRLYASQHSSTKRWRRCGFSPPPVMKRCISGVKMNGVRSLSVHNGDV